MTRRHLLLLVCLAVCAGPLDAQEKGAAGDPVTGQWRPEDGNGGLDLQHDGKGRVTGTVHTLSGPAPVKSGTFDSKTGVLRLEGDTKDEKGTPVKYVIEGKIDGETVTGTWQFGEARGKYRMTRTSKG